MSLPSVTVLMGGPDAEREVSIMSGTEVAQALRDSGRFHVVEHIIDKPDATELATLVGDVVFPVLHGQWGEGGGLQTLLERIGVPFVGSRSRPAALAMDKLATKMLLTAEGVMTPSARQLLPGEPCDLEPPLVLKPVDDGSSVDLVICRTTDEVETARRTLHANRGRLMAERLIEGREITVGIVLDETLPLVEVVPADGLYDYAAKYERDDTGYIVNPQLDAGVADQCRQAAMQAWYRLGCRDVARVDFMVDDRGPWFLEINTMPGFTTHSLVPMAAARHGLPMPELCARLVEAAMSRGPHRGISAAEPGFADMGSPAEIEVMPHATQEETPDAR